MKPTSIRLRSGTLDTIRGLTLVSMIVYHACWDLVYLYRLDWGWYRSFWAGIWQQSICCTFILLSGFCWQMGRHPLRRGLMSFFGLAGVPLLYLPRNWYANTLSAGLGFPAPSFVSSDYFPLLPWLFLFWAGFYLYRLRPETPAVPDIRLPGIGAIGRRSLMVYLLHQPVIYGLLALIFSLQEVHLCLS